MTRRRNGRSEKLKSPDDESSQIQAKLWQYIKDRKYKKNDSADVDFLGPFLGGILTSQNDLVNEIIHIDDSDDVAAKEILNSGATVNEPIMLDSDDDTKIESSKPARYLPDNGSGYQHELMENPNPCDAVSLPSKSSQHLSNLKNWMFFRSEMGIPVILKPDHIVYGDKCSTNSILTFSCSSIKIEGSFSLGTKLPFTTEWTLCDIVSIDSFWCKSAKLVIVDLHLQCKDAEVNKLDNENSGPVVIKFAFYVPDWYEKQEAIKMLDVRYKDKWNNITVDNFEAVTYPEVDPRRLPIIKSDVDLLQPKSFINDTIIDFYMMHLENKMNPAKKDRFHFANSFFFKKLVPDGNNDPSIAWDSTAAFNRVHGWTKDINLFAKDFIFIPVNSRAHWTLIVICHPGEVATFRAGGKNKSFRTPCILYMDSTRGSYKGLETIMRSYLLEEWKWRHGEVAEVVARKFLNLRFVCPKLPQQDNQFDCGIFLLHYVELFLDQGPVNFNLCHLTASSKFLAEDWFSTEDVACKREHIKGLICDIMKNRVQKETWNAREACRHQNVLSSRAGKLLTVSSVASYIKGLKSAAVSEVISRDLSLARDTVKPHTDDNYQHYGQKAPRNLFGNLMSLIEEEVIREQKYISPTIEAGSQHTAAPHASSSSKSETLFVERFFESPVSEVLELSSSSTNEELASWYVQDPEEVSSKICWNTYL